MQTSGPLLAALLAFGLSAGSSFTASAQAQDGPSSLVPLYVFPDEDGLEVWQDVVEAANQNPVVVIVNPDSGPVPPGHLSYSSYAIALPLLDAPNITVLGYVRTCYLASGLPMNQLPAWCRDKTLAEIRASIRADVTLYAQDPAYAGIEGIFFDEASSNAGAAPTYRAMCQQVKDNVARFRRVVLNPGTNTSAAYLATPACDAAVVFEGTPADWQTYTFNAWVAGVPAGRVGVLLYAVPTEALMHQLVDEAHAENAGLIYVTDDGGANPWDTLPPYWEAEVAHLAGLEPRIWGDRATGPAPAPTLEAFPNPSASGVTAVLRLDHPSTVGVAVYDALGRRVAVLADGPLGAGEHRLTWDVRAAPGVYILRAMGEGIAEALPVVRQ